MESDPFMLLGYGLIRCASLQMLRYAKVNSPLWATLLMRYCLQAAVVQEFQNVVC